MFKMYLYFIDYFILKRIKHSPNTETITHFYFKIDSQSRKRKEILSILLSFSTAEGVGFPSASSG